MAQKNDPFIGSNWGWDEGENGWGLGLNETLIQLAFLQNRRIDGIVSSLPETPADGEAYFLTLDKRVYFRVDGSWYGSDVPEGMDFILKSTEERYEFDGTTLTPVVVISDAVDVDYNNSVSGLTADNVQDAVDELVEELSGKVDVVVGKQLSTEDYTTAEKNKLSEIQDGATANETDAYLLNRANHEGTQPQSTVENLVADLNSKQTIANLVQDLSSPNSTTYLSTQGLASAFADIVAGEVYKGEWDADTNTPPLTSGVGVQGEYYQVSVAGNTNLDGISTWALGDEVLFDGTVWKKRANYQSVVSVNGQTGPVVLSASDVGAVSSITMTVPTGLQVSGSPITSSGTLAVTFQSGYSIPTNANQANWTIAYNERNRWDGGSTGLNAATGRTSLGLGTASQANLVTSATDTTAGSVPTVDWMGLGGNGVNVSFANNDFSSLIATSMGAPNATYSVGLHIRGTANTAGNIAIRNNSMYHQSLESGVLGSWLRVWDDANLVKTTSATDITTGRVPVSGWLGNGRTLAYKSQATDDLNDFNVAGAHGLWGGNSLNRPTNSVYIVHVLGGSPSSSEGQIPSRIVQVAYQVGGAASYRRSYNGSSWGAWQEEWNTGNLVKTTSPRDRTPGSMLQVDAGGLLGTSGLETTSTPLDDYPIANGFINGSAMTEETPLGVRPMGIQFGATANNIVQLGGGSNVGPDLRFRKKIGASWAGPYTFWHTGNLTLTTGPADTTAGRAMTVGSGGLLGVATYQSVYDFDALGQVMQGRTMTSSSPGTKPSDDIPGFPDNCFVLPAQRSSGNNMVQLAIAFEGGYSRMAHRHYSGSSWSLWVESWTTGNTSADVQWMLGAADIPQIRSRISAAKATVIRSVTSATHDFAETDNAAYHRFTFSGAKTATVRNSSSHTFDTNYSAVIRNAATSGNLTIVASSGVTINPPYGGTLVLEPGMTATLFKVGINEWDLIGQTVPA